MYRYFALDVKKINNNNNKKKPKFEIRINIIFINWGFKMGWASQAHKLIRYGP